MVHSGLFQISIRCSKYDQAVLALNMFASKASCRSVSADSAASSSTSETSYMREDINHFIDVATIIDQQPIGSFQIRIVVL